MLVTAHTYASVLERIERCTDVVVDLETTGLRPYHGDRLFGVAVEAAGEAFYFPFRHARTTRAANLPIDRLDALLDLLTDGRRTLGGHNFIRFDVPMIAVEDIRFYDKLLHHDRIPKWDTIIDAMLSNENEPSYSLDALGQKYLGAAVASKHGAKEALLAALRRVRPDLKSPKQLYGHMAELTPEEVEPYACGDVVDTRALRQLYRPNLERWGLEKLSWEYYAYARLLAKIERRGLLIDRDECERRIILCEEAQADVLTQIRAETYPTFNPNSPVQVCKLFGTPDAQAETLMLSKHPLAGKIVRYKQLGKMRSTYYEGIRDGLDPFGVIHPQMNLTRDPRDRGGTRSGRLSCSNPNFQNLTKRATDPLMRVRDIVIARPGHVLLPCDYQRAEMWMAGHYSGDQSLADAYYANRDLYVELARDAECSRQEGKIGWLMIQYGAGAFKISDFFGWDFTPRDKFPEGNEGWDLYNAQRGPKFKRAFFELVPGVKHMMQALTEQAERVRSLRLWTGRVRHFDGVKSKTFSAWNAVIQGAVGEMVRVAMQRLEEPLERLGGEMLLQVHDEIIPEVPEENAREAALVCKRIMEDFPQFRLPPRTEPSIGRSYGAVEPFALDA